MLNEHVQSTSGNSRTTANFVIVSVLKFKLKALHKTRVSASTKKIR